MAILLRGAAATALLTLSVTAAYATYTRVYYQVGRWEVFSGQTDNGQPFCGIGTTDPSEGRSISIQFDIGARVVDFRAARAGWSIPSGTKLNVVMRMGDKAHWSLPAHGSGNMVHWSMDRNATQAFDDRFRHTRSLVLVFPEGNEPAWNISLTGSRQADNAFGRCIADLGHGTAERPVEHAATQPFRRPPASFAQAPSNAGQQMTPR